jgi:hypothetical protein
MAARMPAEPANHEIRVLGEKFRALQTLVRYERDIQKLQVYKRDLEIVNSEFQRAVEALGKRSNAKIIPFASKKPVRSA